MVEATDDGFAQDTFKKLKVSCVPLLGNSKLTPTTIPTVAQLLQDVINTLREAQATKHPLKPSIISYVFFPLSTILQRNPSSTIPDQVLERLLLVMGILCESWWWDMDERAWEQVFMLLGATIGGLEGNGKGKERDDETKAAAVQCLWALLRERSPEEDPLGTQKGRARQTFSRFQCHAQREKFMPIIGQSINSLLTVANSQHHPLQCLSLKVLHVVIKHYLVDGFTPSILPGVSSTMCRVALGIGVPRGWANADVVAAALMVLQDTITLSIGDDVCVKDGAVKSADDLESLTQLFTETTAAPKLSTSRYSVARAPNWLNATASQLHMAINSLQPLVTHPTPPAQTAFATFSGMIIQATTLTLPQSQLLLLSYLLSLSVCEFPSVSSHAKRCIQDALAGPRRHNMLQVLLQISKNSLTSLPRLISTRSETKIEHAAGIIEAICSLSSSQSQVFSIISTGIGGLLGPNGGIEKWGWSLLPSLEFTVASIAVFNVSAEQLLLDSNSEPTPFVSFPELTLRHISSYSTQASLQRMFRSLGRASGETCIYAIEWFLSVGRNGRGGQNVSALWCACRLLEGAASVTLAPDADSAPAFTKRSKRFEKLARTISKAVAETWEEPLDNPEPQYPASLGKAEESEAIQVQHVVGLLPVRGSIGQRASLPSAEIRPSAAQSLLHKMVFLQLLSVASGILEVRFVSTLLHTLYPILHSLISETPHLVTTALATLQYVANAASYASPANLLLSNFDYALDAVSRRFNRRWLDINATSVLVILVRLVGRDVVQRASDVVEECFDRLDEYHGYEVLVNGLVSVLAEVVEAVAADSDTQVPQEQPPPAMQSVQKEPMQVFLEWYTRRMEQNQETDSDVDVDIGPVPQEAWGANADTMEQEGKLAPNPIDEPLSTPTQLLVQQIVTKSMYFLTHDSRLIRARILALLTSAATVLPASLILPSIHHAWPFVLNRLADPEPFVVGAAATLVEALVTHFGDFMHGRIWDDVWPRFREMLRKLEVADSGNALARRGPGAVGTESAYTHSHRLYRALLRTMTAAVRDVQIQDNALWEVIVAYRRFLHSDAHEELQTHARELYVTICQKNEDAVWFALTATQGTIGSWTHLRETKWDIRKNAGLILQLVQ